MTNKGPGTLFSGQELTLTEALPVGLANVTYTTSGGNLYANYKHLQIG